MSRLPMRRIRNRAMNGNMASSTFNYKIVSYCVALVPYHNFDLYLSAPFEAIKYETEFPSFVAMFLLECTSLDFAVLISRH